MKKFIILGLIVLFVFLSAQGLYEIKTPAKFRSWVKIGGDFIPIWDGRSNLGHSSYWFDSSFVEHGWFNYIQIDSGGYLKLDSLSVGKVVSNLELGADSIGLGIGTADSMWIHHDGTSGIIKVDDQLYFMRDAVTMAWCDNTVFTVTQNFDGSKDASNIRWDGKWLFVDYDADDSLAGVIFGATDSLKWDSIPEAFTLTAPLTIEGDLTVSGEITSTSVTRGQATFTRNTEVDTVPGVTGVSTNSVVLLTPKMATALTGQLTWTYLNTDSILVHILPADTTGQAVIYCWFRIE